MKTTRCKWLVSLMTVFRGYLEGLLDHAFPVYEPETPGRPGLDEPLCHSSLPSPPRLPALSLLV